MKLPILFSAVAFATVSALAADSAAPVKKTAADPAAPPKPAHSRGASREVALEDLKKFTVADGLEVTLFASEPMMVNPCDMDVDARGRVWITEGANYRKWANPPVRPGGDRIVVMEDTDGDGAADKSTVFYQGLDINSALGICVLGNKVIVSCAPNVFVFTDEDGDGKSDKKEVLFTGIKGVQHDHAVHAFSFGPDGKLYFNFGNAGEDIRDKDGKPIIVGRQHGERQGQALPAGHGLPLQHGRQRVRSAGPQLPQQLRGRGRFLRHALAVRQRR